MRLAELLSRQGNFDDAENWWRQIAASGNTFAAGRLGDLLANRDEVDEAEIYLRRAVEAGEANAAYNLAYCLTRRNDRESVIWWERVVEEGHAAAQQILDYLRNHDDEDWSRIRIAKDCRGSRPR
jgi:TPR repeat protein